MRTLLLVSLLAAELFHPVLADVEAFRRASCAVTSGIMDRLQCPGPFASFKAAASDVTAPSTHALQDMLLSQGSHRMCLANSEVEMEPILESSCPTANDQSSRRLFTTQADAPTRDAHTTRRILWANNMDGVELSEHTDGNAHFLRNWVRSYQDWSGARGLPRVVASPLSQAWPNPWNVNDINNRPIGLDPTQPAALDLVIPGAAGGATLVGYQPLTTELVYEWRTRFATNIQQTYLIKSCLWWSQPVASYGGVPLHLQAHTAAAPAAGFVNLPVTVQVYITMLAAAHANQIPWLRAGCDAAMMAWQPFAGGVVFPEWAGHNRPALTLQHFVNYWALDLWETIYSTSFENHARAALGVNWQNKRGYSNRLLQTLAEHPSPTLFDGQDGDVWFLDGWWYVTDPLHARGYRLMRAGGYVFRSDTTQGMSLGDFASQADMIRSGLRVHSENPDESYSLDIGVQSPAFPPGVASAHRDQAGHVRGNALGGRMDPLNFFNQGQSANDDSYGGAEDFARGLLINCPCNYIRIAIEFTYAPDILPASLRRKLRPAGWTYRVWNMGALAANTCPNGAGGFVAVPLPCGSIDGVPLPVGQVLNSLAINGIN